MDDTKNQAKPVVGFLVMAFTDEKAGDEALKAMQAAKQQKKFYFENAAVIRQDAAGKVHYHETGDMSTGKGASVGALVGGVIGIFGGPAGVALGATLGAGAGAAIASRDTGFRDESLKTVGQAMKPGTSAVAAITSLTFLQEVQKQVKKEEIHPFVEGLSAKISARLNEGRNVALGILLMEAGLVYKEVAVDEKSAEVISLAITDEAVAAGAAVITADRVDYGVVAATSESTVMERGTVTPEGAVVVTAVALPEKTPEKALEGPKPAAPALQKPVQTAEPGKEPTTPAPKASAQKAAPAKPAPKKASKPAPKKTVKKAKPAKKASKPAPKKTAKKAKPTKKAAKPAPKKTAKKAPAKKSSKKK